MTSSTGYVVREITEDDPDYITAIRMAASAQSDQLAEARNPLEHLLNDSLGRARVRPVVGCFATQGLCFAVVAVEAGRSNLLLFPFDSEVRDAAVPAIRLAVHLSQRFAVVSSQIIAPPLPSSWDETLRQTGFHPVADLEYLIRPKVEPPSEARSFVGMGAMTWITYSDEVESVFVEALLRTYEGSMDCPEIQNLRSPPESLASHRAAGAFNPEHWHVLVFEGEPAGVLLLSQLRRDPWMEIVYMGVAQPMRRTGVADELMRKAIRTAIAEEAGLILAVDVRNAPAKRLYARFGFQPIARRSAWIAKLGPNES